MNPPAVSPAATVFGGEHVTVTYRTGFAFGDQVFAAGATESVLVRELEVDPHLLRFGALADQPAALAEFICERPAGWGRALAKASLIAVVDKAVDLNFTTARLYLESRAKLKRLVEGSPAQEKSPASTTSAAAPA